MYIILIFLIITSVLSIFSIMINFENQINYWVVCLPLVYGICGVIFYNTFILLKKSFVFKIFQLQALVRYLILPVLYSSGQSIGVGKDSNYIEVATGIMCIELLIIYSVFLFYAKKQQAVTEKNTLNIQYIKKSFIVPIVLVVLFAIIYLGGALDKVNFVWDLANYVDQYINQGEELEVNTLSMLLFNTFKVILILYLISLIQQFKIIKRKKIFVTLVILASTLVMVGLSRFSMVLNLAVLLAMLPFMFSNKDVKKIFYSTIPFFILILTIASIAKFSRYDEVYSGTSLVSAASINAYFLGFGNIAIGVEAFNTIKWSDSVFYLFNDTLQNVPILSKLTDDAYKTTIRFNETIYGHKLWADQIVPLSISGLFHFGFVGIFIYNPLFIAVALFLERCAYQVKYIGYKYVCLYLSVVFSLVFMLNLGSFYASLIRTILFLFIPILILKYLTSLKFTAR